MPMQDPSGYAAKRIEKQYFFTHLGAGSDTQGLRFASLLPFLRA
jgi:hypothetical protein